MRCPKCEHEQPEETTECVRCGLVFSKWKTHWEQPAGGGTLAPLPGVPSREAGRSEAATGGSGRPWVKVAGLLATAAGWYWFFFWTPGGLSVAEQAYRDQAHGFAVVAPEGWQSKKTNSCKTVTAALTSASACTVLELQRGGGAGQPGPIILVTVMPVGALFKTGWGGSVRLVAGEDEDLARTFEEGLAQSVPGYTSEARDIVPVDKIASLRVHGSATIKGYPLQIGNSTVSIPNLFGDTPEHSLAIGATLVPSSSDAYLISYACETADYGYVGAAFDQVIESFRVIARRPTEFQACGGLIGSMRGDLIMGALVGLTLAFLRL